MPTFPPKLAHGHGQPGTVRDTGPLREGLPEYDLTDQRANLVQDIDGGVDENRAADGDG